MRKFLGKLWNKMFPKKESQPAETPFVLEVEKVEPVKAAPTVIITEIDNTLKEEFKEDIKETGKKVAKKTVVKKTTAKKEPVKKVAKKTNRNGKKK